MSNNDDNNSSNYYKNQSTIKTHLGGIVVAVDTSSVVDCRLDQPKYYKPGICCFSDTHTVLSSKSK